MKEDYPNSFYRQQAKDKAITAISKYLEINGWVRYKGPDFNIEFFGWVDPVTELVHRSDFAYIIQSERDIYERQRK